MAVLTGLVAPFDSLSEDLGGFRERIAPGAFDRTLAEGGDVLATFNHSLDQLLGRTSAGTLRLESTRAGLVMALDVPETTLGLDVCEMVRLGNLSACSFTFSLYPGGELWTVRPNGEAERVLTAIRLHEVAIVVTPAYQATTVGVHGPRAARAVESARRLRLALAEEAERAGDPARRRLAEALRTLTPRDRARVDAAPTPAPSPASLLKLRLRLAEA